MAYKSILQLFRKVDFTSVLSSGFVIPDELFGKLMSGEGGGSRFDDGFLL